MRKYGILKVLIAIIVLGGSSFLKAAEVSGSEGAKLLPSPADISGWRVDGDLLSYQADNLWEYINGAAEHFLMYEFQEVVARHYLNEEGLEIKVEIYEHLSPLMAFGIYSQFRGEESENCRIGNEGFKDDYSVQFWKDRFFVRIYAYEEGEESARSLREFARAVEGKIKEKGELPLDITLFPATGMVIKSLVYLTEGVLGSGMLPPAFAAEYSSGEEKGKLYIFTLESEKKAAATFAKYTGELGFKIEEARGGERIFSRAAGEAPYRGRMVLFQCGRRMGILTGFAEDSKAEESLVQEAVGKILQARDTFES
ncbi:MAG: hypothetical protein JXB45_10570 [Candidatus Krumholzibacteriota bacterium]|nr:hypothetical protein [Candidatus Krumholzibacteriota bacterium]